MIEVEQTSMDYIRQNYPELSDAISSLVNIIRADGSFRIAEMTIALAMVLAAHAEQKRVVRLEGAMRVLDDYNKHIRSMHPSYPFSPKD